jgi:hypothetical protein
MEVAARFSQEVRDHKYSILIEGATHLKEWCLLLLLHSIDTRTWCDSNYENLSMTSYSFLFIIVI